VVKEISNTAGCSNPTKSPSKSSAEVDIHMEKPHEHAGGSDDELSENSIETSDVEGSDDGPHDLSGNAEQEEYPKEDLEIGTCGNLPTCQSIDVLHETSCEVYCNARVTHERKTSFWVGRGAVGSNSHSNLFNCGEGCVCVDLRLGEPSAYACTHYAATSNNEVLSMDAGEGSSAKSIWIALGFILSFVLLLCGAFTFYMLVRRRPSPRKSVTTTILMDGSLEKVTRLQMPDGSTQVTSTTTSLDGSRRSITTIEPPDFPDDKYHIETYKYMSRIS